jgi:hypothetical protein
MTITDKDLIKLKKVFATKNELAATEIQLETKIDNLEIKIGDRIEKILTEFKSTIMNHMMLLQV